MTARCPGSSVGSTRAAACFGRGRFQFAPCCWIGIRTSRGRLATVPPAPGEEGDGQPGGGQSRSRGTGAGGVSVCADDGPRDSGLPSRPPPTPLPPAAARPEGAPQMRPTP